MSDDYKLVPTKDFNQLQSEVLRIKSNPLLTTADSTNLSTSLNDLHQTVTSLLELFTKANEDLTLEQREERLLKKHIGPVENHMKSILDQNEVIANGIITVSRSIDAVHNDITELRKRMSEMEHKISQSAQQPQQTYMPPMESSIPPDHLEPQNMFPPAPNNTAQEPKKFGLFKK